MPDGVQQHMRNIHPALQELIKIIAQVAIEDYLQQQKGEKKDEERWTGIFEIQSGPASHPKTGDAGTVL